jgi:hypothetical protein
MRFDDAKHMHKTWGVALVDLRKPPPDSFLAYKPVEALVKVYKEHGKHLWTFFPDLVTIIADECRWSTEF